MAASSGSQLSRGRQWSLGPRSGAVVAGVVGIAGWELVSLAVAQPFALPGPVLALTALGHELTAVEFYYALGTTLATLIAGAFIGFGLAVVMGIAVGLLPLARSLLTSYTQLFRFVTPIAWVGPATLWFGAGDALVIFLVAYVSFFIVFLNTIAGIAHVERDRIRVGAQFGASFLQRAALIVVPSAIPFILTGMRIAIASAFLTVIGVEMVASNGGLGYLIYSARAYFRVDFMFAILFVLGLLGLAIDYGFNAVQRRLFGHFFNP